MREPISSYPSVRVQEDGRQVVSQAGSVLLVETVRKVGLDQAISAALAPWRRPRAVHDPGKVVLDLALAVALGGDCLADAGLLRAEPAVFGPVASDPTVSRLVDTPAVSGDTALQAIRSARAEVRERVWWLADRKAPDADGTVTTDLDGVLVIAHSDKQDAAPTWKRTYGHHPLMGFVDHGPGGTGEPVAALLRPGNAGSNTAADHITAARLTLAQPPKKYRRGRQTLIRTDSAGGTHDFVSWLARRGRWLSYSVGMVITDARAAALPALSRRTRNGPPTPSADHHESPRPSSVSLVTWARNRSSWALTSRAGRPPVRCRRGTRQVSWRVEGRPICRRGRRLCGG
ncbi:transposase [Streptomyces sp. NPDC017936]|uniref:transposase n=1 Tax=Streptomyces sp. NPDC017936 TaxID=3365016 RepID=UPI003793FC61